MVTFLFEFEKSGLEDRKPEQNPDGSGIEGRFLVWGKAEPDVNRLTVRGEEGKRGAKQK